MSKFITFEGVEGCGKSTQSKMLYDYLVERNMPAILTREIGGTSVAEDIRKIVLHSDLLPMSELLLVMAARCEHINKLILPSIKNNLWVICDRFIDSTACYQGMSPDIGVEKVFQLHRDICNDIMPDTTIFIDVPPSYALVQALARGDNNKFEEKDSAFHNRVYSSFQSLASRFSNRIHAIPALGLSKESLHKKILEHLELIF